MSMTWKPSSGPTTRAMTARRAEAHGASTKISSVWRGVQERNARDLIRKNIWKRAFFLEYDGLFPFVWITIGSFWDHPDEDN